MMLIIDRNTDISTLMKYIDHYENSKIIERMKPGLKKTRKAPQFSKR
ncbi:hypothetical protein [Nosocomiicoccus massiliensis]|uniref:Uncharacterized protein n=1 Tax=Nosocomiicoccus massiliensis TaxID=1232430 RepID=A0AAF0YHR8_9STAP|nr:hypothetical protein [Nosocomiicoccus massiliensis]WOS95831.1 hypothetical protein CJ229_006975 [Nosocomiicoccus massiliensis]